MAHRILAALALVGAAGAAQAIDFRSVDVPAAILYDAPSQKGKKLYLIKAQTPVEVVVRLEGWFKVRDAEGGLAWIEKRYLSDRRTVIVRADRAEIRQKAEETAPLVFEADRNVALDYLETVPGGWIKVRHADGASGFVRASQIWGF